MAAPMKPAPGKNGALNKGIKSYRTGWLTREVKPGVYATPVRAPYAEKGKSE